MVSMMNTERSKRQRLRMMQSGGVVMEVRVVLVDGMLEIMVMMRMGGCQMRCIGGGDTGK